MTLITRLVNDRQDIAKTELRQDRSATELSDGEVLLQPQLFALSTNNITYAAFGESMGYWDFFPAGDTGVGHMPVWGYGIVAESKAPGVTAGERFFGYFPIASHLKVRPSHLKQRGFLDGAEWRQSLPKSYNYYERVSVNPTMSAAPEDLIALFRPLYPTSYLLADYLVDSGLFGALSLLLSSASSKTAYGAAFYLKQMTQVPLVGLTSPSNRRFVEGLGCYDRVMTYDQVEQIGADKPMTYVDFSSDPRLRERIHRHFGDSLVHDCYAGSTASHEFLDPAHDVHLPGPKPVMHVAFDQLLKRNKDWGPEETARRLAQAQTDLLVQVQKSDPPWVRIETAQGFQGAAEITARLAGGRIDPALGFVVHM